MTHRDGAPPPAPARPPASLWRRADGTVEHDLSGERLHEAAASGDGTLWVDVDTSDPAQAALLRDVFHFHPLAVEDAVSPHSRVKVDEYPDFLVVVARVVAFRESTPDPYDLETANLTLFLTRSAIVSAHVEALPIVADIVQRLRAHPELLERGPARVAHLMLDGAVDAYFPVLDQVDEFVDDLEQRVFGRFDESLLQEIFRVKRLVIALRRYLAPQREVMSQLTMRPTSFLTPETQLYFRDVYDHMLRITDALDSYRDLLGSTLDSYLTQVSNRLGRVSKGLALIGAVTVPFVVIAGVYGMNFQHIPLSGHPHGFAILVAAQAACSLLLVAWLRWRRLW